MKNVRKFNKMKSQKTRLPLLMKVDPEETGELVRFVKFNSKDFIKRLERALAKYPEFRPPYTTADMPACVLDYRVFPDLGRKGSFILFMDFLPGDKAYNYIKEQED